MGAHLIKRKFKSDKYGWCPPEFVPLKTSDPHARVALRVYVALRKASGHPDTEFNDDLLEAIRIAEE